MHVFYLRQSTSWRLVHIITLKPFEALYVFGSPFPAYSLN